MSAHSKTSYITPSMEFSSGKGVVRGTQWAAAEICLGDCARTQPHSHREYANAAVNCTRVHVQDRTDTEV